MASVGSIKGPLRCQPDHPSTTRQTRSRPWLSSGVGPEGRDSPMSCLPQQISTNSASSRYSVIRCGKERDSSKREVLLSNAHNSLFAAVAERGMVRARDYPFARCTSGTIFCYFIIIVLLCFFIVRNIVPIRCSYKKFCNVLLVLYGSVIEKHDDDDDEKKLIKNIRPAMADADTTTAGFC
ncbi:hypothetical protein ABW19_dt0205526 [Dactylella cylindrospora]|nr:hypothetical protein ABW19_dt0205526 [Dactylella cylindrospora]